MPKTPTEMALQTASFHLLLLRPSLKNNQLLSPLINVCNQNFANFNYGQLIVFKATGCVGDFPCTLTVT